MRQQIPWATASGKGRSSKANGTRLVNLYAEALPPDSKTPVVLYGTPGQCLYCELPTFPVLALCVMSEKLYAATPTKLYLVEPNGYTELGDIDFSGRVSCASNGFDVVFVDGKKGYAYNADNGVSELSGDGWYPANTVAYQDGYFAFNRAGTGQWFISQLVSTEFDAQDFASAEGSPDDTLAVLSDHREMWLFGEHSTEIWYNSGDPDFPFERMQGAFVERGIAASHSAVKMDNSVFWVGDDRIVYRANGYLPGRISTHAVEQSIAEGGIDDAYAFTYSEEGHKFYVLTFPSLKKTWCFDVATGLWHERSHYEWGRHNSNCYAYCYDQHLVGDFQNGRILTLNMDVHKDDSSPIRRVAVSPPMHFGRARATIHSLELDMDSGFGVEFGQGSDPQAMLRWSDDGGKTWSNEHWTTIGKVGEYLTRVKWNRLGMARQRQFEISVSDPVPVTILSAHVEVEGARH